MTAGQAGTAERGAGAAEREPPTAAQGARPVPPTGVAPTSPATNAQAAASDSLLSESQIPNPESRSHTDSRFPIPDSRPKLHLYYGGTFDPIHRGHLAIACAARDALGAQVHLVPAADPPHRPAPGATAAQRTRMLELALADLPGLLLDTREVRRAAQGGAPSYTVDTLHEVRAQLGPAKPIAWLLGADAFVGLPGWHEWTELFGLAHLVIAARPGTALDLADAPVLAQAVQGRWATDARDLLNAPAGRLWRLPHPLRGESASAVRSRIAAGGQWQDLVPSAVAAFIAEEGLYGCVRPAS